MAKRSKKRAEALPVPSDPADKIRALIKQCDSGDKNALVHLKEAVNDRDAVSRLSNLAYNTEEHWLGVMCGKADGTKEFVRAKLQAMRRNLSGTSPTPLEQLLIGRISVCWLQVQYADTIYAQNLASSNLKSAEFMQRRQESAHRRFVSSVKALAQVRRLSVPLIQLNVADKQINMLSGQSSGEEGAEIEHANDDSA